MSTKSKVSVIVTTKNEEAHIKKCLDSISTQSYKNIEIIVVDNSSVDNTKKICKIFTKLIFNKGPERSAQRNFGARKAKGEFFLFIDADMALSKNVVKECVEKFNYINIGGIVVPEKSIGIGFWAKVKTFERSLYEGDSSIEAARFFRAKIFNEFGGYDEDITGPEDWDLPRRISKKYKIERVRSYIVHDEGRMSIIKLIKKKYYYGLKASFYIKKHPLSETTSQVIYLLRPAYYKHWKTLYKNPILTLGMIVMLTLEQIFGFAGFISPFFKSNYSKGVSYSKKVSASMSQTNTSRK